MRKYIQPHIRPDSEKILVPADVPPIREHGKPYKTMTEAHEVAKWLQEVCNRELGGDWERRAWDNLGWRCEVGLRANGADGRNRSVAIMRCYREPDTGLIKFYGGFTTELGSFRKDETQEAYDPAEVLTLSMVEVVRKAIDEIHRVRDTAAAPGLKFSADALEHQVRLIQQAAFRILTE